MKTRHQLPIVVVPLLLTVLTGCTSMSLKKPDVWPLNISDNTPGMPSMVIANFSDTLMYQGSETPVRGFGGRVLFYTKEKKDPIKVEGSMVVYAFDENNRDANNNKPDRKFVFTKDQLEKHYSKSKLGHSYSVWLPWDEAGGNKKDISLIVRFMPEKGSVVVSEQTKLLLPGKSENVTGDTNAIVSNLGKNSIQKVSYESPTVPASSNVAEEEVKSSPSQNMITTTINLPRSSVLTAQLPDGMGANPAYLAPQGMPAGMNNNAANAGQMPSMPNGAAAYPAGNTFNAPMNPMVRGGMNLMVPVNCPVTNQAFGTGFNSPNSSFPPNSGCLQPTRFAPGQYQVPGASFSPPAPYHAPLQPRPSAPGFGPGVSTGSMTNAGFPTTPEAVGSPRY
jgi:hypothetical protein